MNIIEILKAVLFGVVEGITEWLPISSTGHLILINEFVKMNVSDEFMKMFDVVIQLGAIMAVVVLFWNKLWPFGKKNNRRPWRRKGFGAYIKSDVWAMWFKVLVACIPAAVVGLLLDDWIDEHFYNAWVVAIALIVFGVAFILVEDWKKGEKPRVNSIARLSFTDALVIGLFQLLAAIFPGTSRSGATIVGALIIGISRVVATEFTFFLAIPVMFGASLLKLVKFGFAFTLNELVILITGMAVSFIVSVLVIRFLMGYVKKHDFKVFGWYRIILGIIVLVYFLFLKK